MPKYEHKSKDKQQIIEETDPDKEFVDNFYCSQKRGAKKINKDSKSRESELAKISGNYKSKTTKHEVLMFSTNFREGMTFPNLKLNGANDWNRYINIYKNLMRDVKRFFGEQYKMFLE